MIRTATCVCISLILSIHEDVIQAAQPNKTALVTLGAYDCLPVSTFGLANIRLWEPRASAIRKLGKPDRTTQSKGEDDGGGYEISSYHYRHFSIDIVREVVDRIYTKLPHQKTTEGIRVGDSRAEVIRKLGATPRNWNSTDSAPSIVTCEEKGQTTREDYVTYNFDKSGQLVSIEYAANRP
jgi:hypothetical protein